MPEYFFHIVVELMTESPAEHLHSHNSNPPLVSHLFQALKPFTHTKSRRVSRDHSYDNKAGAKFDRPITNQKRPDLSSPPTLDGIPSSPEDHRLDSVYVENADMSNTMGHEKDGSRQESMVEKGIGTAISGQHTKGHYTSLDSGNTDTGWGIVHLYRDTDETPGLYKDSSARDVDLWNTSLHKHSHEKFNPPPKDEDCTSLCILAVPSYMTPFDFLAFVGEETRSKVSHFRMVRTARANRYMVLMKFKHGKQAREWQHEWNGKVFNSMEPETCHVVFLKSVEIVQSTMPSDGLATPNEGLTYPRMTNDPFMPPATTTAKPVAPRTPSLVELPTCPVCLERMDETTGLLTILCQHVFHCTCLQKWSGGGCPVCRYTHDDFSSRLGSFKLGGKHNVDHEMTGKALECETCHVRSSLWQCLICGRVGCGRYEGKHAYTHYEETGHAFSMDLESKRVWDYVGDGYVHRIIQDAANPGEKLVELPGRRREPTALEGHEDVEMAKMDNIALEYTHLLTSQLESQRVYFEEIVERAADKASEANKRSERAIEDAKLVAEKLAELEAKYDAISQDQLPELEREKERLMKRSNKFEEISKSINQKYLEEKSVATSLLKRIEHLEEMQIKTLKTEIQRLEEENATKDLLMEGLRDEHRDAMMQVSASKKLQEMVANGELDPEDLQGASIMAGPPKMTAKERLRARLRNGRNASARGSTVPNRTQISTSQIKTTEPTDRYESDHRGPENDTEDSFDVNDIFSTLLELSSIQNNQSARKILDECREKLMSEAVIDNTQGKDVATGGKIDDLNNPTNESATLLVPQSQTSTGLMNSKGKRNGQMKQKNKSNSKK